MQTEIEFSVIAPMDALRQEVKKFEAEYNVRVRLRETGWANAWPELLKWSMSDTGPDISCIGSTWVSSLINMNSMRPFSARDIAGVGGQDAFLPAAWNSGYVIHRPEVWSLPWSSYAWNFIYRRDVLQRAGVDEAVAFASAESTLETMAVLTKTGRKAIRLARPPLALLHLASSWVWGAGGEFVNNECTQFLFNQPAARAGLQLFFELFRFVTPEDFSVSYDDTIENFIHGDAATLIAGIDQIYNILAHVPEAQRENFGIAALPGIPWIGGGNLVIWNHTRGFYERERAAIDLATYLTGYKFQVSYCSQIAHPPARLDALHTMLRSPVNGVTLTEDAAAVAENMLRMGREHKSALLWTRSELQINTAFERIANSIVQNPQADIEGLFSEHLKALEYRLNLTLE